MTRLEARDVVRFSAEIPGENVFDYLINLYFNEELASCTALRRYVEAMEVRYKLTTWFNVTAHGQVAQLPTDMQHLDEEQIYFAEDNNLTNLTRIRPYNRTFQNITGLTPRYWRIGSQYNAGNIVKVLYLIPQDSLVVATDFIYINYWKTLTWAETDTSFPIPKLESVVRDRVVERIASLQKTGLAKKYAKLAQDHYIASLGTNV